MKLVLVAAVLTVLALSSAVDAASSADQWSELRRLLSHISNVLGLGQLRQYLHIEYNFKRCVGVSSCLWACLAAWISPTVVSRYSAFTYGLKLSPV
ncbi:hypothetical protein PoB_007715200 [Plakobranchus ocellatus]|uniref:Uncharacterized protein n=1 Tax=Plakobranchus ocellatus TaxID=259542 RepID=A0AAV4E342_9GAST|nr:hypothetical protein PoB_007715200 [Plakobranchus ocellatus]